MRAPSRAEVKQYSIRREVDRKTPHGQSARNASPGEGIEVFKIKRMNIIQLLKTDRSFGHVATGGRILAQSSHCCELRPRLGRIECLGSPKKLDQPPGWAGG